TYRKQLTSTANSNAPAAGMDIVDEEVGKGTPLRTRFVVDILSGTSAGGINAVYLAKALANDQSIDELKKLWVNEGDIALLINDKSSVTGLHLKNQNPPLSLLNSRRMYLKLLKAFDDMDGGTRRAAFQSPYVDELDLYITATDIEGVPLPLRLSDAIVYERRHRNVFHFKYATAEASGEDRNDFITEHNPFLAFAARCTSSFPFAFEPMRLCDIDEVLDVFPHYRRDDNCKSGSARWQRFFKESINPRTGEPNLRFSKRSFGDGGYLDNKPFSYATETLMRRQASVPVDRKLIYIEPSPEHPEDVPERNYKPDALENVKAALVDLPTYETIREDLQRVLDRNRLISRVNRLIANIEQDIEEFETRDSDKSRRQARLPLIEGEWNNLDLAQSIGKYGLYYLPYRRLRIAEATDQMATLVARVANFDSESDLFVAIRCLVRAWRGRAYVDYRPKGVEKPTVNNFLNDYDYTYRLRRLSFVRNRIDLLYRLESLPILSSLPVLPAEREAERKSVVAKLGKEQRVLIDKLERFGFDYLSLSAAEQREFGRLLLLIKCELNLVFKQLRTVSRDVGKTNPAKAAERENATPRTAQEESFAYGVSKLGITTDHLKYLLGMEWTGASVQAGGEANGGGNNGAEPHPKNSYVKLDEEECRVRAVKLIESPGAFGLPDDFEERLNNAALALRSELDVVLNPTGARCKALLNPERDFPGFTAPCLEMFGASKAEGTNGTAETTAFNPDYIRTVRAYLWSYYSRFDDYDQISFPIFYETGVAESDVVEVIRISPEDATSLIDERREQRTSPDGRGRQKLAGNALHHFGAFLDRVWRQNDIMWGRLDGAERLITALLPEPRDEVVRRRLIREAQTAIFIEELPPESRRELGTLMSDALVRASAGEPVGAAVERVIRNLKSYSPIQTRLETVMRNSLTDDELLAFMSDGYEVNRQLDPKPMLRALSRSTQVIGRMFEEIANSHRLDGNHLRWIARLGQVFWGLVETAVPNSILNQLIFHWLKLLYVFE
ncbi:MAG: patatin-like protein, partial [Acidobacteriota bacterium]|nr:patatin-like protein [Acidobacteriota bacterium]